MRWTAQQNRSSRHVRNNPGLRPYLAPLINPQMTGHCRLTTDLHNILQDRRTGYSNLRNNHVTAAELNIMADLHQVIDARVDSDDGVDPRSIVVLAPTSTSSSTITRPS